MKLIPFPLPGIGLSWLTQLLKATSSQSQTCPCLSCLNDNDIICYIVQLTATGLQLASVPWKGSFWCVLVVAVYSDQNSCSCLSIVSMPCWRSEAALANSEWIDLHTWETKHPRSLMLRALDMSQRFTKAIWSKGWCQRGDGVDILSSERAPRVLRSHRPPIRSNCVHSKNAQRISMPSIVSEFINVDPASSQGHQDHLALEKHHRHIRFVHHHLLHHRIPVCETNFRAKWSKLPSHQRLQISAQTCPCQFANQTTHFMACVLISIKCVLCIPHPILPRIGLVNLSCHKYHHLKSPEVYVHACW